VGPCAAKKLEASRHAVRSHVDFVLTFEEFASILEAKGVDVSACEADEPLTEASGQGRGFAVGGGVAKAVEEVIKVLDPNREVLTARAEGLPECRKLLQMAKAGKYNGYLLEGMACPGGCVAGAGVIAPSKKAAAAVEKAAKASPEKSALNSSYLEYLSILEDKSWEESK
jgi:iron only hydrogenase large subunit-like protein